MNAIGHALKTGLYQATQSFSMLWHQKKLLAYLAIVSLIMIIVKIITLNSANGVPFFKLFKIIDLHIAALPSWLFPFEIFVPLFLINLLTNFFTISLLHHIASSMNGIESTIKANILNSKAHVRLIAFWTLLSTIFETVIESSIIPFSKHEYAALLYLLLAGAVALWFAATFFMLPLIALHNQSIIDLLKLSATMCKTMIFKIIGGEAWFGLMIILVNTPFFIILLIVRQPIVNPVITGLGLIIAEIAVKCWIATAHNIFKVMLMQSYSSHADEQ